MVLNMRMKKMRKCFVALMLIVTGLMLTGFTPYESYTYSTATGEEEYVYSPAPYTPYDCLDAPSIGTTLSRPVDFAFDDNGCLYIVDSGLNKLIILNQDGHVQREISSFDNEGQEDFFYGPNGFFLTDDHTLYICDTENSRIVVLDENGELIRIYSCPSSPLLGDEYNFRPSKIVVDEAGTMYVINTNEYSGLMKLSEEGEFISFIGSNKSVVNPLLKIWKSILTETQKAKMISFVPVEYENLSMDNEGFIYAVCASSSENTPVKRLNLSGTDILVRSGYVEIAGDVISPENDASILVDICSADNGDYFVLDSNKCRIFTYNQEGYLLYAFGRAGNQLGTFKNPSAIECYQDKLYVLDSVSATITIFDKTEYAKEIEMASNCYYAGDYEQSEELWNSVLKSNAFYELAYTYLGKINLKNGDNVKAMKYFELGNYRGDTITFMTGYNKAASENRKEMMAKYLGLIVVTVIVLWVLGALVKKWRAKNAGKEVE